MSISPETPPEPSTFWSAIPAEQRTILGYTAAWAAQRDAHTYLVGGPVRDFLLGRRDLRDIDITLTIDAREVARQVAEHLPFATQRAIVRTTQFGTATLRFRGVAPNEVIFLDLATTRTEAYPAPGALPVVSFPASITDDLARRDFTINAMALPITPDGFGHVLDPHGGQADLDRGVIRALHPTSFRDDPTRLFRAVRYATRFRFALEPDTASWFAEALNAGALDTISRDRKRHEIELGMLEPDGAAALAEFAARGLLTATSPALIWSDEVAERLRRLLPLVREGALREEEAAQDTARVISGLWPAWAAFVLDHDDTSLDRLFVDIPMTKAMQTAIRRLVRAYRQQRNVPDSAPLSEVAHWFGGIPYSVAPIFFPPSIAERIARLEARRAHIHDQDRAGKRIAGGALDALGVPPDARRRRLLDALRDARLDGIVDTVEDERRFVERYLAERDLRDEDATFRLPRGRKR